MSQADGTNALSGWAAAGLGGVLSVPLVSAAVFFLSRVGLGDPERDLTSIAISVGMFAVIPAALTAWGLARVVARGTSLAAPGTLGVLRGAIVGAPAGVGLIILAALPLGHLPRAADGSWWWVIGLGTAIGALLGGVVGAIAEPAGEPEELAAVTTKTAGALADRPAPGAETLAATTGFDEARARPEVGDARRDSHPVADDEAVVDRQGDERGDAGAADAPASLAAVSEPGSASVAANETAAAAAVPTAIASPAVVEGPAPARDTPASKDAAGESAPPAAPRHRRKRKRKRKGKRRGKR